MDLFVLKKLVSTFLHLLPGSLVLMLVAMLARRRWPRLAGGFVVATLCTLVALHSPPVANALVRPLEQRYPAMPAAPADTSHVLVLADGHIWAADRSPNVRLMASGLSRITEAVRIWKTAPGSTLIVSGAPFLSPISNARAMADTAVQLGVPKDRITLLESTRDTLDEIRGAVDIVRAAKGRGGRRLLVVSTAIHLRRAAAMLEGTGIDFAMVPTDYLELDAPWYGLNGYFLRCADRAVHEYVGLLWYRMRYRGGSKADRAGLPAERVPG